MEPILRGEHALLAAPTAGGKTEAATFPLLSRMLSEPWTGLSILYVCPLKALLNDLEGRLCRYARLVGRSAALWHGDVGAGARRRIRSQPPDILLTTPESIEVLLTSRGGSAAAFFGGIRAVVIDEIHAFAGDDRGWHLLAVLERVARFAREDVQRIGLSATLGNPEALADWMAGSSPGPRRAIIDHEGNEAAAPDVRVDSVGTTENAARVISSLHKGEKRLVFCDSRSRVEDLAYHLRQQSVQAWVSHSSLSIDDRRQAEQAFAEGSDCVIVATSTLELGIDVGDLDRVLQIDSPPRVASFLQRLGRTGRRAGSRRNMLFLATRGPNPLLTALALLRLWREGYVEALEAPAQPFHVIVQQIFGLIRQQGGLEPDEWRRWIGDLPGIRHLDNGDLHELLSYLETAGWLFRDGGILGFGPQAEERFAGKRLLDLFSVFTTSPLFKVRHGNTEVGQVDEASFLQESKEAGTIVLLLGGRAWAVQHLDWENREAFVKPVQIKGRSLWPGTGQSLSYRVCQAMRDVLVRTETVEEEPQGPQPPVLTRRGLHALSELRGVFHWLPTENVNVLRRDGKRKTRLWTFAGLRANCELAGRLAAEGIAHSSLENLAIVLEEPWPQDQISEALRQPSPENWLSPRFAAGAVQGLKLHECLPPDLALRTVAARMSDPEAVEQTARRTVVEAAS